MNYGEQLAYWYLRLNGFFPLSSFVVHRSSAVQYTSDIDVLAIRAPYVYEEIGGQHDDWDRGIASELGFGHWIGLVCEVKTGQFDRTTLFRQEYLRYAVGRLGLVESQRIPRVLEELANRPLIILDDNTTICKLLISSQEMRSSTFVARTLANAEDFLAERVRRYPQEKFADRMFFPSQLFQFVIAQVHREIERRTTAG